ncbi:MAG TPA: tRNA-uridine aminocarboxypropyltransferase, partial [Polyangiales bacterium]|nr:tRNA-uridine aminocarboxypropyltransferase [Polyangiales bacterium]
MSFIPRIVCYRCHKPQVTCICSGLPRVSNRTPVLVLQHPRERLHPVGTARFARLGLENARVEIAWDAGRADAHAPDWLPQGTALLYPAADARDLRELPLAERPGALLVLDGTWHTARTLYRDKLWLRALPHVRFMPAAPGRYRLRREPELDYVSTIEAIVEALGILEPETEGLPQLLAAFDAMIDRQLAYVSRGGGAGRKRKRIRPPEQRRTPHALVEGFEQLVVVYGESSRPKSGVARELVYLTAFAPHSGARFERMMLPEYGMPDEQHLGHMGLTEADFVAADGCESLGVHWRAFLQSCGRDVRLAAWNQRTLELLAGATGERPRAEGVSLKMAYRSVFGVDSHSLDEVVAQRGLGPVLADFKGRAARRLSGAVAVARLLHARAVGEPPRSAGDRSSSEGSRPSGASLGEPPRSAGDRLSSEGSRPSGASLGEPPRSAGD